MGANEIVANVRTIAQAILHGAPAAIEDADTPAGVLACRHLERLDQGARQFGQGGCMLPQRLGP